MRSLCFALTGCTYAHTPLEMVASKIPPCKVVVRRESAGQKTLANLTVRLLRRAPRDTIQFVSWHKVENNYEIEHHSLSIGSSCAGRIRIVSLLLVWAVLPATSNSTNAGVIVVNVFGHNNPFLAGAPNGATALGDFAPQQSPTLALTGFDTTQVLTFSAIGGFNFGGGVPIATADGQGLGNDNMSAENLGISGPMGIRFDALVGVFLDDSVPSGMAPASLNSGIAFTSLSPGLRQIFWIGDGLTGTGTGDVQQFFCANWGYSFILRRDRWFWMVQEFRRLRSHDQLHCVANIHSPGTSKPVRFRIRTCVRVGYAFSNDRLAILIGCDPLYALRDFKN
jgi:hypothetical protein